MIKASLEKRKREWKRFGEWEALQKKNKDPNKTLHLIGEWVDFFLLKHPRHSDIPDVRGIQKMHQSLSHISLKK